MEQSPKTKEYDLIMILSSLAYITPIRLLFCISDRFGVKGWGGGVCVSYEQKNLYAMKCLAKSF